MANQFRRTSSRLFNAVGSTLLVLGGCHSPDAMLPAASGNAPAPKITDMIGLQAQIESALNKIKNNDQHDDRLTHVIKDIAARLCDDGSLMPLQDNPCKQMYPEDNFSEAKAKLLEDIANIIKESRPSDGAAVLDLRRHALINVFEDIPKTGSVLNIKTIGSPDL